MSGLIHKPRHLVQATKTLSTLGRSRYFSQHPQDVLLDRPNVGLDLL